MGKGIELSKTILGKEFAGAKQYNEWLSSLPDEARDGWLAFIERFNHLSITYVPGSVLRQEEKEDRGRGGFQDIQNYTRNTLDYMQGGTWGRLLRGLHEMFGFIEEEEKDGE